MPRPAGSGLYRRTRVAVEVAARRGRSPPSLSAASSSPSDCGLASLTRTRDTARRGLDRRVRSKERGGGETADGSAGQLDLVPTAALVRAAEARVATLDAQLTATREALRGGGGGRGGWWQSGPEPEEGASSEDSLGRGRRGGRGRRDARSRSGGLDGGHGRSESRRRDGSRASRTTEARDLGRGRGRRLGARKEAGGDANAGRLSEARGDWTSSSGSEDIDESDEVWEETSQAESDASAWSLDATDDTRWGGGVWGPRRRGRPDADPAAVRARTAPRGRSVSLTVSVSRASPCRGGASGAREGAASRPSDTRLDGGEGETGEPAPFPSPPTAGRSQGQPASRPCSPLSSRARSAAPPSASGYPPSVGEDRRAHPLPSSGPAESRDASTGEEDRRGDAPPGRRPGDAAARGDPAEQPRPPLRETARSAAAAACSLRVAMESVRQAAEDTVRRDAREAVILGLHGELEGLRKALEVARAAGRHEADALRRQHLDEAEASRERAAAQRREFEGRAAEALSRAAALEAERDAARAEGASVRHALEGEAAELRRRLTAAETEAEQQRRLRAAAGASLAVAQASLARSRGLAQAREVALARADRRVAELEEAEKGALAREAKLRLARRGAFARVQGAPPGVSSGAQVGADPRAVEGTEGDSGSLGAADGPVPAPDSAAAASAPAAPLARPAAPRPGHRATPAASNGGGGGEGPRVSAAGARERAAAAAVATAEPSAVAHAGLPTSGETAEGALRPRSATAAELQGEADSANARASEATARAEAAERELGEARRELAARTALLERVRLATSTEVALRLQAEAERRGAWAERAENEAKRLAKQLSEARARAEGSRRAAGEAEERIEELADSVARYRAEVATLQRALQAAASENGLLSDRAQAALRAADDARRSAEEAHERLEHAERARAAEAARAEREGRAGEEARCEAARSAGSIEGLRGELAAAAAAAAKLQAEASEARVAAAAAAEARAAGEREAARREAEAEEDRARARAALGAAVSAAEEAGEGAAAARAEAEGAREAVAAAKAEAGEAVARADELEERLARDGAELTALRKEAARGASELRAAVEGRKEALAELARAEAEAASARARAERLEGELGFTRESKGVAVPTRDAGAGEAGLYVAGTAGERGPPARALATVRERLARVEDPCPFAAVPADGCGGDRPCRRPRSDGVDVAREGGMASGEREAAAGRGVTAGTSARMKGGGEVAGEACLGSSGPQLPRAVGERRGWVDEGEHEGEGALFTWGEAGREMARRGVEEGGGRRWDVPRAGGVGDDDRGKREPSAWAGAEAGRAWEAGGRSTGPPRRSPQAAARERGGAPRGTLVDVFLEMGCEDRIGGVAWGPGAVATAGVPGEGEGASPGWGAEAEGPRGASPGSPRAPVTIEAFEEVVRKLERAAALGRADGSSGFPNEAAP